MKKYDAYKPSGVDWIGEIPEGWEIKKIKHNFEIYAGATPKTEKESFWDGDVVWITPADYKTDDKIVLQGERNITIEGYNSCNTQLVPQGSLIFSKRAPIGTVALSGVELCTNQGCLSCVPKKVNSLYYYYVISICTEFFDMLGSGATFKEISADAFANVKLPTPQISEQTAIANYLDAKCAKIDKVVAVQRKRIELLKELKQSIITHAVTKGLDKTAKMKDSGIDWIGKIPEGWKVKRLKLLAKIKTGTTPPTKVEKYYDSEDIKWYTPSDITDSLRLNESERYISNIAKLENAGKLFPAKTIYFVGIGATIGKVAVCDEEASCNQQVNAIIPNKGNNYLYLAYCLRCQKEIVYLMANVVTLPIMNQEKNGELKLPVPPFSEQTAIVEYLDKKCATIDKQIAKVEKQIELLKEYKQSVITECVTGKRKVC